MSAYGEEGIHLRKYLTGIIGNAPFGIITLSSKHDVGIINSEAVRLLGFENSEPVDFIDAHYMDVFVNLPKLIYTFHTLIKSGNELINDLTQIKINQYTVNIRIRELFNGSLLIIENVTKQAELEGQLRHQATHDSLTSLGNRLEFEQRVTQFIAKSIAHNLPGAVLFIDLDRFKPVNDTAGHAAGDELLKRISAILLSKIRDRDMIARIGGDEFAVLLADCPLNIAEKIAESMRKAVEEMMFVYEDYSFQISLSIGVSPISGMKNDKLDTVINAADNACQIAKNEGRNRVHTSKMDEGEYEEHQEQIAWLPKITKALESNLFVLYAQEIALIKPTDDAKHYELLIRLQNEDGSIVPPGVFIPPAERYDLMPQIDRWVIEKAFATIEPNTCYSINLSGQSASDETLAEYIEALQEIHKINSRNITFEITETAAIQNIDKCMTLIHRLKSKGFLFSLDDFGSGLSSFTYLKNMPIDFLKIDGLFVKDIATDETSYAMVKSINEVGHTMGLKTIAEFVENQEILDKLETIGVDYAQGYHVHKPESLDDITVDSNVYPIVISK